jgi:hypothetical protein
MAGVWAFDTKPKNRLTIMIEMVFLIIGFKIGEPVPRHLFSTGSSG